MSTIVQEAMTLDLSNGFTPDVDLFVTNGFTIIGESGSGKTGVTARILEQIAKYYIPLVIFDKEGDFLSINTYCPRGYIATIDNLPTAKDILEQGLQVIVDLSTWDSNELAADMMASLISDLMDYARTQHHDDRVPCLLVLDEAQFWLPQRTQDSNLDHAAQVVMKKTWQKAVKQGRKLGIIPSTATQNISQMSKACLSGGVYILMRQTLHSDLNRYGNYIQSNNKQRILANIRRYPSGKAVIVSPVEQRVTTFYERQSIHISHTPTSLSAHRKFAKLQTVHEGPWQIAQ